MTAPVIPNRPVFRAHEVCEIADVQPYVLRSWEAEFPDLGTTKSGQRVYRRGDVERVLRLKQLLFAEGLTLAGARRRMSEEGVGPAPEPVGDDDLAQLLDEELRQGLRDVRRGLQWVLGVLSGDGVTPEERVLMTSPTPTRRSAARSRGSASAKKSSSSRRKAPARKASGRSAGRR